MADTTTFPAAEQLDLFGQAVPALARPQWARPRAGDRPRWTRVTTTGHVCAGCMREQDARRRRGLPPPQRRRVVVRLETATVDEWLCDEHARAAGWSPATTGRRP